MKLNSERLTKHMAAHGVQNRDDAHIFIINMFWHLSVHLLDEGKKKSIVKGLLASGFSLVEALKAVGEADGDLYTSLLAYNNNAVSYIDKAFKVEEENTTKNLLSILSGAFHFINVEESLNGSLLKEFCLALSSLEEIEGIKQFTEEISLLSDAYIESHIGKDDAKDDGNECSMTSSESTYRP